MMDRGGGQIYFVIVNSVIVSIVNHFVVVSQDWEKFKGTSRWNLVLTL